MRYVANGVRADPFIDSKTNDRSDAAAAAAADERDVVIIEAMLFFLRCPISRVN